MLAGNDSIASAARLIAEPALGASSVEQGVRVVQQGLHGRRRRDPGGADLEGERTLLVGQSDKRDRRADHVRLKRSAASRVFAAVIHA